RRLIISAPWSSSRWAQWLIYRRSASAPWDEAFPYERRNPQSSEATSNRLRRVACTPIPTGPLRGNQGAFGGCERRAGVSTESRGAFAEEAIRRVRKGPGRAS